MLSLLFAEPDVSHLLRRIIECHVLGASFVMTWHPLLLTQIKTGVAAVVATPLSTALKLDLLLLRVS